MCKCSCICTCASSTVIILAVHSAFLLSGFPRSLRPMVVLPSVCVSSSVNWVGNRARHRGHVAPNSRACRSLHERSYVSCTLLRSLLSLLHGSLGWTTGVRHEVIDVAVRTLERRLLPGVLRPSALPG